MELIFEIRDAEEGGYHARALGHAIFTEAETWEELRTNILDAVSLHFEEAAERPRLVQLHYVRDELIPLEAA
jgi:predicted RNase H-like HicB family nuclease